MPKSVAQHTQVYANHLEALLAKRAGPRPAAPATRPADALGARPLERNESEPVLANSAMNVGPARTAPPAEGPNETAEPEVAPAPQGPPETTATAATRMQATDADKRPSVAMARPATPRATAERSAPTPATTDQLLQKLAARVRDYPRDTAAQLDYQLLRFLRDEPVPELGPIAPLPAEDREVISAIIDGLSNFRAALRGDADMLQSKKVAPLLEMGDRLRAQGDLVLPAAALCTKVARFGVYDPMTPARFKPGTHNEAILYCEVANFSSQLGDGKQWETRLKHEVVLYSEVGLAPWKSQPDIISDRSRNRRRDFHIVELLVIPPMPVGRYLLKVSVTDQQANRVAETTIPIEVVAAQ